MGTVIQVGPKVTKDFKPGDRIAGFTHGANAVEKEDGCFAEYAMVKGDVQCKVPENLSDEEACTLGIGITTVGQGLYRAWVSLCQDLEIGTSQYSSTAAVPQPAALPSNSLASLVARSSLPAVPAISPSSRPAVPWSLSITETQTVRKRFADTRRTSSPASWTASPRAIRRRSARRQSRHRVARFLTSFQPGAVALMSKTRPVAIELFPRASHTDLQSRKHLVTPFSARLSST